MRKYREVVFQDTSTGKTFRTRSTAPTNEVIRGDDGREYPLVKIEISSDSHPAFTGTARRPSPAGRVEAFRKRYGK